LARVTVGLGWDARTTTGEAFDLDAAAILCNDADGSELARYDLSEDASTEAAMVFGELYRNSGEWKFRAVGQGYQSGLRGIAVDYGLNV
jgi:tellurium resistance protein TerD